MKRSYLFDDRDIVIPPPSRIPEWKRADHEEVTPQTLELLSKLQEFFPQVSIFSWHPNIPQAQYRGADMWGSNYNARILIGDSIIVRSRPGTKSLTGVDRGWDTVRNAMKHIKEAETLGGNSSSDETTKSYQMQISFLKTVGTHEESNELKYKILTHGAYSFKDGIWYYIPADKFNPWYELEEKMDQRVDEIVKILENHPKIKKINREQIHTVYGKRGKEYDCHIGLTTKDCDFVLIVRENYYKLYKGPFNVPRTVEEHLELNMEFLLERLGGLTYDQITALVEDPSSYSKVLYEYRGTVAARKFGFS